MGAGGGAGLKDLSIRGSQGDDESRRGGDKKRRAWIACCSNPALVGGECAEEVVPFIGSLGGGLEGGVGRVCEVDFDCFGLVCLGALLGGAGIFLVG